jgi:hypothetical protein
LLVAADLLAGCEQIAPLLPGLKSYEQAAAPRQAELDAAAACPH